MAEKTRRAKACNSSESGAKKKNSERNQNPMHRSERNDAAHQEARLAADDDRYSDKTILRRRVNAELANYFYHIASLFEGSTVDLEEKPVICGSALQETRGEELALATDVILSRTLQILLEGCDLGALCGFLSSSAGVFSHIATDKCGSHVAETALKSLVSHLQDPEALSEIEDILRKISEALVLDSASVMASPYGSHVLRSLICLCKGVGVDSLEDYHVTKSSSILAERLNFKASQSRGKSQHQSHRGFPETFKLLVTEMLREAKDQIPDLRVNKYSSFVLQTALKLLAEDEEGLLQVILLVLGCPNERAHGEPLISSEDASKIVDLIEDTASSHLLEVIVGVASESLYDELLTKVFRGSLAKMAAHHCGNFVVQALLSSAKSKPQVELMWEELHPLLRQLLETGKSGVIASLLAACHRLQTHGLEVAKLLHLGRKLSVSLTLALRCSVVGRWSTPCARGLTLRTPLFHACSSSRDSVPAGIPPGHGPLGRRRCTQSVAWCWKHRSYRSQKMIQPYIRSILSMDADQVAQTARDAGGGRVLEAFLCSDCSFQQKIKVVGKLQGCFGELSLNPSGSFTVEKCFDASDLSLRSTIASELLAVRSELSKKKHGAYIIKKLDMDGFESRPEQWRRRQENRDNTFREFQAAFGTGSNRRQGGGDFLSSSAKKKLGEKKKKKKKTKATVTAQDGVAAEFPGLEISMAKLGLPDANNVDRKRKRASENPADRGSKTSMKNALSSSYGRSNANTEKKIPFLRRQKH